ncbi:MAG TPA: Na(+)-translocating NADH-quinone reductase subunit A, partial [Gammaproteobacteria bacterium]|nr:Na(+)-translocating NADH-quinone reductase subunit A [Gammaproteobacteria bacterium]
MLITIKKGLDLPISGAPEQVIHESTPVKSVALVGDDYPGIRPKLLVNEGERVKLGQALFVDKHTHINYTSPASGIVSNINRGAKRVLQSVVIRIEGNEELLFENYARQRLDGLVSSTIKENLLASGLWTAFRTRPFSKNPDPATDPHSIFVTAMDTSPLAADPGVIIREYAQDFMDGLTIVSRLANVKIFVCKAPSTEIPVPADAQIVSIEFAGPHPAGLAGTHIHFVDPVDAGKTVWYLNYQDVIAIGKLFTSGRLWTERIISLAGPQVLHPQLLRTRLGADTGDLTTDALKPGINRIISGSVLAGRHAKGPAAFLGRYHTQVSVINEGGNRELLGWLRPGRQKFSANNIFVSCIFQKLRFNFTTSQNGSRRAMIPLDNFERIMPLDILPTLLLRALLVRDAETARLLGCLELDEEDLALCSF